MKELTDKARDTRARIAQVAMRRFGRKGFEATTVRDIADDAGCALGLVYRYFPTKEAIVLYVYNQTREGLERAIVELPPATLGRRFRLATEAKLTLVAPHRKALLGVLGAALSPTHPLGVFADESKQTRRAGVDIFRDVAAGATDVTSSDGLARLLYMLHLMTILVWTQDASPDGQRTRAFLDELERTMDAAAPLLALPIAATMLSRADALVAPLLDTRFAEVLS